MNPEEQREFYMREWAEAKVKSAKAVASCRFTMNRGENLLPLHFEVGIDIDHYDDWDALDYKNFIKNILRENVELNTGTLKDIADAYYIALAMVAPGRKITITIYTGDTERLTIYYT